VLFCACWYISIVMIYNNFEKTTVASSVRGSEVVVLLMSVYRNSIKKGRDSIVFQVLG
jgi:hypothetical protein